jgi:hypothetical protein
MTEMTVMLLILAFSRKRKRQLHQARSIVFRARVNPSVERTLFASRRQRGSPPSIVKMAAGPLFDKAVLSG